MSSITKPELTSRWWSEVRPSCVKSKYLEGALADYEKAEKRCESEPADAYKSAQSAVASIESAIVKTIKECDRKADKDAINGLGLLARLAKRRLGEMKDAAEEGDEDSEESPMLDIKTLKTRLRMLTKSSMACAFGTAGREAYFVLDRYKKGPALRTALEKVATCQSSTYGIASVEAGELCIEVTGPKLSGLRKKVKQFLMDNQPLPYKDARVLKKGEAADDDEDDEDEADGGDQERDANDEAPVAATRPFEISASVGKGGANRVEDVMAAQTALNRRGAKLLIDGKVGPATIKAIEAFQHTLGVAYPDGRIDPGGKTETALRTGKYDADKTTEKEYGGQKGGNYGGNGGGGSGGNYGGKGGGGGGDYGGKGGGGGAGDYGKKNSGEDWNDKKERVVEEKKFNAGDYVKKVAGAVNSERKRVDDKVEEALKKLRAAERSTDGKDAEEARRKREQLEQHYEEGKAKLRNIKKAADDLIADQSAAARKAFEDAAKSAGEGLKKQRNLADEGADWISKIVE